MVIAPGDEAPTRRRRPKVAIEQGNGEEPDELVVKSKSKKRRRRAYPNDDAEEPFLLLLFKVGLTLAVLCLGSWHSYRWIYPYEKPPDVSAYDDDDDADGGGLPAANTVLPKASNHNMVKQKDDDDTYNLHPLGDPQAAEAGIETPPPLPVWELGTASQFDAYSIADKYKEFDNSDSNNKNNNTTAPFWRAASGLRRQFAEYYGGENAARALLERGLTTGSASMLSSNLNSTRTNTTNTHNNWTVAGDHKQSHYVPRDLHDTACRMQEAAKQHRPFRMAFGGYSVTVGRGNYFPQSFPLVMEKHLHTVFSLLGLELQVKNAAIGGCPAL
jgi:hypothetical protein